MHRDVKPSNIFLDCNCKAVLADFGWARVSPMRSDDFASDMTEYVSTRWYRAPELLLGARWYTMAIDIWALACVTGEMFLEAPLIMGTSTLDMLTKIEEMVGKPPAADFEMMEAPFAMMSWGCMMDAPPNIPLEMMFPGDNELLVDFMQLLLQYNPLKRMNAGEALAHPFLGSFHDPDGEPICERPFSLPLSDDEQFPAARYRDQIYADLLALEPSKRRIEDEERQRLLSGGSPSNGGAFAESQEIV
mmetsp:Transcript_124081/g.397057  ORF Transcript_124081/g.397057 Transcript_124081/m.397057 type:complete len:247 (+) Transcript_124081:671-1411(+)